METIKIGKGKKGKNETEVVIQFSGALNANAAENASAYEIAPVITVKAAGKGKNHKPGTTKLGAPVALSSAVYDSSNQSVTLTSRVTLSATKPEELIVNGSLLTDTLGREIDGSGDGRAGSDYIATISGGRAAVGEIAVARRAERHAAVRAAIDDLLARGELTRLTRRHRVELRTR